MKISTDVNLAECTSFGTGGRSEVFAIVESVEDVVNVLNSQPKPFWLLGRGANTLISDKGLPGTTIQLNLQGIEFDDDVAIVESGYGWHEFAQQAISRNLWGVELTSGIPGTVGAAVVGNIAAYGQSVADTLLWVEVIDYASSDPKVEQIPAADLELTYRSSKLARAEKNTLIILRAAFQLSKTQTMKLEYESALKVARELELDTDVLEQRVEAIMETRKRAGSLLDKENIQKTAGSFFKNPMVTPEQADEVMGFEERKVSKHSIKQQNAIHGGAETRVSAAHVVLAAGFHRGQSWGPVRIHPEHALKIENTGGATSQQIYDVAQEIMQAADTKLGIPLEAEVRFMGDFS